MKTVLVVVGLLSLVACPTTNAIPISSSDESQDSDESKALSAESNETSNESVYLVKEVAYEVGVVDTVNMGNSSKAVIVKPADRIETDDITLWTAANGSAPQSEMTTNAIPAEATTLAPSEEATSAPREGNNESNPAGANKPTDAPAN